MRVATAEWADPALVETRYAYRDGTVWLGRSASENQLALGYRDDRHVCLVSGSRGGKGTSFIIPSLIEWPGSICVVDPKGENATITAARRGGGSQYADGLGQAVRVLDPFKAGQVDESLRGRFNPLDALDPENEETVDEAGRIADAIVVVHESNDPFWDESARSMVKGLILHVLTAPEYEGRRNLVTLRKLVLRGDWEAVEALKGAGERDIPPAHGLLWTAVANNTAFAGLVAGIGDSFTNMLLNSPKQFESVLQVANRNTEFLDSPPMQRSLEKSDFQLSELKTRPEGLSLYLCLPQRFMSTHYRWLRMMIALTVTEMEKVRGRPVTGHPVLLVLDEFAGLKKMEVIENSVAQIAGHGVKMLFVLQSLEQLKAVYKDNWETFLANSGLKIFFNLEDHFSRDYVSKLVGETELIREVRSASDSTSESESYSRSVTHSQSETRGRSSSTGTSDTAGTNESVSKGRSSGVSKSKGKSWNWGESESQNWSPGLFFRHYDDKRSSGKNTGESLSVNTTKSEGWNTGESHGTSQSTSRSRTEGTSESWTTGRSETEGTTRGTSRSRTAGTSETIQKRALVTPDEIGQLFSRVDDTEHQAYPGLALVVISGARPVALRRVNYYEDYQFMKMFDPHPDYPFRAPKELTVEGRASGLRLTDFGLGIIGWCIKAGEIVAVNQPAALVGPPQGDAVAHIRIPRAGAIKDTCENGINGDIPEGRLFSLLYYEDGSARVDPFAELRALCEQRRAQIATNLPEQQKRSAKPLLKRPGVLALAACALVAAVSVILSTNGRKDTSGSGSYAAPPPARPMTQPPLKKSQRSEPPMEERAASPPAGAIMIGKVDVSKFAGLKAGDTMAQVASIYGSGFKTHTVYGPGQSFQSGALTVLYEDGRLKWVTLDSKGLDLVRTHASNDPLVDLFGRPEADAVALLGPPSTQYTTAGGAHGLSWNLPNSVRNNDNSKEESRDRTLDLVFTPGYGCDYMALTWAH
jgi:type IV secretory pathway TraG/TraD family ATPase VirD4